MVPIKKFIYAGAIGLAIVTSILLHYKKSDFYRCQTCWATKNVTQWYLGSWPDFSVAVTPKTERLAETHFHRDFLGKDHVHTWDFAQGSPYMLFGTTWGGCGVGSGRYISEISKLYESHPEFRNFVLLKVASGSLTKSNIVALVAVPGSAEKTSAQEKVDALLDDFFNNTASPSSW